MKSELSSTAGSNLAAKVMYESTCAVVHLSSIIFHQSSFKSDNLLSFFSFCLTYYLQIAGRVYSREERAVINSWKQPRRIMFIVVGCFTVNSVNMKKKSCSEILKCSVKTAYNSIAKISLLVLSTYISSFKNAFLNDGTISIHFKNEFFSFLRYLQ